MKRQTFFVSGHIDLTEAEFQEHYAPRLYEAFHRGCAFVVGDAAGCDTMTQRWLSEQLGARYTVFHMLERPRHNVGSTQSLVGGYGTDETRDAAMTRASGADIAWVRPGKRRNNGTQHNLDRRRQLLAELRLQEIDSWVAVSISESELYPVYHVKPVPLLEVRPSSDPPIQAMTDDGMPITWRPQPRIPQGLIDRMHAADKEFFAVQRELEKLLREQDWT